MADKTIRNLTKEDISIVDYKKNLIKASTSIGCLSMKTLLTWAVGNAAIEKAKLFSKTASKGRT